jgi:hypothetical protein
MTENSRGPFESDAVRLEQAVRRITRLTLVLQVVLFVVVVGGGLYAYFQARKALQPERLVATAEKRLQEDFPEIRRTVKEKAADAAPVVAEQISRRAFESVPEARSRLEEFLEEAIDVGLKKGGVLSEDAFRKFLHDHRATIEQGFEAFQRAPDEAPRFAAELRRLADQHLGIDIRRNAQAVLEMLRGFNDKLERLARGRDLSHSEQVERRIVGLLRALQLQKTGKAPPERQASQPPSGTQELSRRAD